MSRCRSCGASVIWTVTVNGKKMPVDAEPSCDGVFFLERDDGDGEVHAVHLARVDPGLHRPGDRLYTSHFATCPNASVHRKP
jgi:hypothetical protein